MESVEYILALEGGGTRCQAVVLGKDGGLLGSSQSGDVNTNFTTYALAQQSVRAAVGAVLDAAEISGTKIGHFAQALVGPRFGSETFGEICPNTTYRYYREQDVIFARAGLYRPHGVAVVAATGATAFAIRQDTHQSETFGGWGALLGDEGSAYAMGLLALRNAVRHWEGRLEGATELVNAICEYFNLNMEDFRREMIVLAYHKPLTRVEVASAAKIVTRLAAAGDYLALKIVDKVRRDLAALGLYAVRSLFRRDEVFSVVVSGGLLNAGEMILLPLRERLQIEFPLASLLIGSENPAVALGRLAIYDMEQEV